MNNSEHLTEENYKILLKYLKTPPKTPSELYEFIYVLTGEKMIYKSVCKNLGHGSPFDYLWYSYRIDLEEWRDKTPRNIIGLGSRGGHKTLTEAKLIAAELLLKPNCETVSMAATLAQANQGYRYVTSYLKHPLILELGLVKKMLRSETVLSNGSSYVQACGTLNACNSKHPQKLRIDEVDLIDPNIVQEALMQPASKNGLSAQVAYTSTRKTNDGTMQDIITKAEQRKDYKIITWCYLDVSQKCEDWRSGIKEEIYNIEDIHNPGETIVVSSYDGCGECVLHPSCKGMLKNASGLIPIEDAIGEFQSLDRATWIAQKECLPPTKANLFFSDWHRKFNAQYEVPFNPNLPLDLAFDFTNGGESPTTCDIFQDDETSGITYLIAALEYRHKPSNIIGENILNFCRDLGITKTRIQVGDSAQMQEIRNLNSFNSFFRIVHTKKVTRKEGWPICKRLIRDNMGKRRLIVSERFAMPFIREVENATCKRSDPDDIAPACSTHHLDSFRYWAVKTKMQGIGEINIRLLEPRESKEDKSDINFFAPNKNLREIKTCFDDYMDD